MVFSYTGCITGPKHLFFQEKVMRSIIKRNRSSNCFLICPNQSGCYFWAFPSKTGTMLKNLIESLSLLSAKHYALVEYSDDDEKNRLEAALPFFFISIL